METNSNSPSGFGRRHLTKQLFSNILSKIDSNGTLISWKEVNMNSLGYISSTESSRKSRILGFLAFSLSYTLPNDDTEHGETVVLKSKARGKEVVQMWLSWDNLDAILNKALRELLGYYGHYHTDHTELACVNLTEPSIQAVMPHIYWSLMDEQNDAFVFAMEYFNDHGRFTHIDSEDSTNIWGKQEIEEVLRNMAIMHSAYYDKTENIAGHLRKWLDKNMDIVQGSNGKNCLQIMIHYAICKRPELWNRDQHTLLMNLAKNINVILEKMKKAPQALIHFDFADRNLCMRKEFTGQKHALCLYDWEFARIGPVQIDLIQFLLSVLPGDSCPSLLVQYMDVYIGCLVDAVNDGSGERSRGLRLSVDSGEFQKIFDMCFIERLVIYLAATTGFACNKKRPPWFSKCLQISFRYMEKILPKYQLLK